MIQFSKNAIHERRRRAAAELDPVLSPSDVLLIFAGEPIPKPGGLDQTYEFLPHPDYYWLTGSRRSHGVLWYSKNEGWVDFVKPVSKDELLWEGNPVVPEGRNLAELDSWLGEIQPVFLGQPSAKVQEEYKGEYDPQVQEALNRARRVKDSEEITLIRALAGAAEKGYAELRKFIRPGVTEREIQIAFETEVLKAGAEKFPYTTIVGSGVNSATLHALPTLRKVQPGELVLVDAGADLADYCVDITRVFAADGSFSPRQQEIYDIVLRAQEAGIALCTPGTPWKSVHEAAARVIADGLRQLGILMGDVDGLLESGAVANFFPHGVGHMVGLRVRDVGGDVTKAPGTAAGVRLRFNLPLEAGFVVTVEPGLYFVPAILGDAERREKFRLQVNWEEAEKWRSFGGVRIEDDVLVTTAGPDVLTAVVAK